MIIPPEINMNRSLHPEDVKILDKFESMEKVLYKVDSEFNNVSVVENSLGRFLKFEDSYQSGILNYNTSPNNLPYINYFLISCLLNPDIKNVLVLGMGTGYLIRSLIKLLPRLKSIDIVEIDPCIVEIAHEYFDFKHEDNVNINIQDARVFVRNSKTKYDLIIMDLFSKEGMPYRFMTEEFLLEVRSRLSSKGILASNLFGSLDFNSNNYIFNSALKTYKSVYKDVMVIPTIYGNIELYRKAFGLQHELSDLTNIILFASNNDLKVTKKELITKAFELKDSYDYVEVESIDKYAEDLLELKIKSENLSVLKDEWENDPQFNIENLKDYLYIDHMVNDQVDKINPVDDESKSVKSG